MHLFWSPLFGAIALLWIVLGLRAVRGMSRVPQIAQVPAAEDAACPRVSILFSALDEAEKLPSALETLLALDYPGFEIIAVDDRSVDDTGAILDRYASREPRLKVVHVHDLPPGWLGKPHGLYTAFQHVTTNWLIFTDADVHFAPDLLRRAMALAQQQNLDHLTLITEIDLRGFWEKAGVSYFILGFVFGSRPWEASNRNSQYYCGVGAFQLLRRSTYESIGTHERLRMEVIDDMKLGKLVKQAGFRSAVGFAGTRVMVRWHDGLRNVIRGVTKNLFAGCDYSLVRVTLGIGMTLLLSLAPFIGLAFARGLPQVLAGLAAATAIGTEAVLLYPTQVSVLYALTQPLGALIFLWMLTRSTVVTLWRGGVVWRGTFYPLDQLKRGMV